MNATHRTDFFNIFYTKSYLLTSAGIAEMYSYKFWIIVFRNQKQKLVSRTRNRVLWWCREPICMFTPLCEQLDKPAAPCSSSRDQFLFRQESDAITSAEVGWLVGGFLSIVWFWLHYNSRSLNRNAHNKHAKNTQALLPVPWGALYHKYWIYLEKSLLPLPEEHPTPQQHQKVKGWVWMEQGHLVMAAWAIGMCVTDGLTWYIWYIFTPTVCTASSISVSS